MKNAIDLVDSLLLKFFFNFYKCSVILMWAGGRYSGDNNGHVGLLIQVVWSLYSMRYM
jgi:hypothetical protein